MIDRIENYVNTIGDLRKVRPHPVTFRQAFRRYLTDRA